MKNKLLILLFLLISCNVATAITASWPPVVRPDIKGYRLYYRKIPATNYTMLYDVGLQTSTSFTLPYGIYVFMVRSYTQPCYPLFSTIPCFVESTDSPTAFIIYLNRPTPTPSPTITPSRPKRR